MSRQEQSSAETSPAPSSFETGEFRGRFRRPRREAEGLSAPARGDRGWLLRNASIHVEAADTDGRRVFPAAGDAAAPVHLGNLSKPASRATTDH
jgi:hypothetical protein